MNLHHFKVATIESEGELEFGCQSRVWLTPKFPKSQRENVKTVVSQGLGLNNRTLSNRSLVLTKEENFSLKKFCLELKIVLFRDMAVEVPRMEAC